MRRTGLAMMLEPGRNFSNQSPNFEAQRRLKCGVQLPEPV